jgi:hypothetical protein
MKTTNGMMISEDDVKKSAKKEAEKIFMKLNPKGIDGKGYFPKVNEMNYNTPYGKEAMRTEKQVMQTRMKQYKSRTLPKGYKFGK